MKVQHLKYIDQLGLSPDDYVIGASGAAVLHGMPIKNSDLDITISKAAYKKVKDRLLPAAEDELHKGKFVDRSGHIDVSIDDNRFPFKEQYAGSALYNGYRFNTPKGLYYFYDKLYKYHGKEKHKTRLEWLKNKYGF